MGSKLTHAHLSSSQGSNPVKQGEVRLNDMGNEVAEGYTCKPKNFDPNRPIMHYKTLISICDDERCGKAAKEDKASFLREIIKEMGLNKGENRIKVNRTACYGACRFRQVCQITENTQANGNPKNSALWLKHTHKFDKAMWQRIFTLLSQDRLLKEELDSKHFIEMQIY